VRLRVLPECTADDPMKTETSPTPSPSGLTRRSFIKRSVVAALATANLTIMSGLVDASAGTSGGGNTCQNIRGLYQVRTPVASLPGEESPGSKCQWVKECTFSDGSTKITIDPMPNLCTASGCSSFQQAGVYEAYLPIC